MEGVVVDKKAKKDKTFFPTLIVFIFSILTFGGFYYLFEDIYFFSPLPLSYDFFYSDSYPVIVAQIFASIAAPILIIFGMIFSLSILRLFKKFNLLESILATYIVLVAFGVYQCQSLYYDQSTDKVYRFYIKTIQGYEFSDGPGYSSLYQTRYKKITPLVIKDIKDFKELGQHLSLDLEKENSYLNFDGIKIFCWYLIKDGKIKLFHLAGLDPETKQVLKPASYAEYMKIKEDLDENFLGDSTNSYS